CCRPKTYSDTDSSRAAKDEPVDAAADVAKVNFIPFIEFGDDTAGIADRGKSLPDRQPVHVAVAEVHPCVPVWLALEVLEMNFHDALAERANPVLGIAVKHDVADIEPRFHPRAVEFADVRGHFERAEQKFVPDFFDCDDDLQLLGERQELADLRLRARPRFAVRSLRSDDRRN